MKAGAASLPTAAIAMAASTLKDKFGSSGGIDAPAKTVWAIALRLISAIVYSKSLLTISTFAT